MNIDASKKEWQLYREDICSIFWKIRMGRPDWTLPFVPWCGEDYWTTKTRILFVGKSVGCFNDKDATSWTTSCCAWQRTSGPDPLNLTERYMNDKVVTSQAEKPQFWLIPMLISGAFVAPKKDLKHLAHSFAWSNLCKVNSLSGEGAPSLACSCQGDDFCLCCQSAIWLKKEIEILKPDLVVLGLGTLWPSLMRSWKLSSILKMARLPLRLNASVVEQLSLRHSPKGIWVTNHFTAWKNKIAHGSLLLEMRKAMKN